MYHVYFWVRSSVLLLAQYDAAKLGVVAYATETGETLHDMNAQLARADDSSWSVLGIGPFQSGTVRDEVNINTGATDFTARVANGVSLDNRYR